MKRLITLTLCLLSIQIIAQSVTQNANESIPFHEATITIDGQLNEAVWNEATDFTGFHNHYPITTGKARNQTTVKVFHNGKNLYVSAVYEDTTETVQLGSLKRDDIENTVASSDAFIIVIDAYNQQQNGYYFCVNMGEAQVDALIERTDESYFINANWNAIWKAKTSVQGKNKIFEMEIPLKALGYDINNPTWGLLFYVRDIKANNWTTYKQIDRNYRPFDLRFSTPLEVENLTSELSSKFTITPSVTYNYIKEATETESESTFTPSLDVQYNLTSSLKLDATINPDFSQIDVDQQVTNLTRFNVFFPERRNFFLENSDLFSNLGTSNVNPFYSRRIGSASDILFGAKLSGNLSKTTRLGVLNVQTKAQDGNFAQNFTTTVLQQQLSNAFTATGFLINRQATDKFDFQNNYNRVAGLNLNYKSKDNKWTGLGNYGKSLNNNLKGDNDFYHAGIWYNTMKTSWNTTIKKVDKNYLTDVGFVPRLYNYDVVNDSLIRVGYREATAEVTMMHFPTNSKKVDSYRYLFLKNNTYWDEEGNINQISTFFNNALWFKDLSAMYINIYHEHERLTYAFDLLQNGNSIQPGTYNYASVQMGYLSVNNRPLKFTVSGRYGAYYNGNRTRFYTNIEYRFLPIAKLRASYEANHVNLQSLGKKTFHLAGLTSEIFFSNRLNWTTYVQYNTQFDNFNINSRLQWEYKPLSYVYLVYTDNYDQVLQQKNRGIALKVNYRLDL